MPINSTADVIYSNHVLQAPDGTPIALIGAHRSEWYLERGLAKTIRSFPFVFSWRFPFVVRREVPFTIRLNFEPKGRGHEGDLYYLSHKENKCVVCGSFDNINRHHVIPRLYRKHMPDEYKNRTSHDVVILCINCHVEYEVEATKRKKKIAADLGINVAKKHEEMPEDKVREMKARKAASILLRHRDTMPLARIATLESLVREFLGDKLDRKNLEEFIDAIQCDSPNHEDVDTVKYILSSVDLQEFVRSWRDHFICTMKPMHLPSGWEVGRSIFR